MPKFDSIERRWLGTAVPVFGVGPLLPKSCEIGGEPTKKQRRQRSCVPEWTSVRGAHPDSRQRNIEQGAARRRRWAGHWRELK
jgi:hypothetical protein